MRLFEATRLMVWGFGVVLCLALSASGLHAAPSPLNATAVSPTRAAVPIETFAVVIGNNKSLGRLRPDLHYADDDAARYFEIFETLAPGRVMLLTELDRDTQRLFPQAQLQAMLPTRSSLEAAGRRLAQQVGRAQLAGHETEVYFIFAGHGDVAQGEGFIELSDARFRAAELESWLKAIPFSRAHVILDSCNSFFMLGVRKPGGRHFATSEDAARALSSRLPNVGVFLSTSAEGEAFEWSEIQSGIFSHVVRSGLLGAADANGDGAVSYLELAAFVDTATGDVTNPNMRPHVFARGPGARDNAPIARLNSMVHTRRFELGDARSSRLRLRDADGLPLLDAHAEPGVRLSVALPVAWAKGAVVERSSRASSNAQGIDLPLLEYVVPDGPEPVTLASLEAAPPRTAARGPAETFRRLFARPYGPHALAAYQADRAAMPPQVYGVSKEDTARMQLVLSEIESAERSQRWLGGVGLIGAGAIVGASGIGVMTADRDTKLSAKENRELREFGSFLAGVGGAYAVAGTLVLLFPSAGEQAAQDFRQVIRSGGDTTQAFALADQRLQDMIASERRWRWVRAIAGGVVAAGSIAGLVSNELYTVHTDEKVVGRVMGGAGVFIGGAMLAGALMFETPAERLTKIWRDDPSLNQYQPSVSLSQDGAWLGLSGRF